MILSPSSADARPPRELLLRTLSLQDRTELQHLLNRATRLPVWRGRAAAASLASRLAAVPVMQAPRLRFDAEACSAWLEAGAAARYGIDDTLCRDTLATTAGQLVDLLTGLNDGDAPGVWQAVGALRQVRMWRTADNDGADGGGVLTARLLVGHKAVRICLMHQEPRDLMPSDDTGVFAAVEALERIATEINRECAVVFAALSGTDLERR
ncbi:hypothetical protein QEZ54_08465 [Catellatospora sp. KI3]|uniref:hypothetical protein n=1 Tax=Catellatospora sp. KI3 TaxID=3041620 RepID=UPI002482A1A9|nr:hypothetical protein [Catellatospora sp. KI3]MDI1460994.1 hypothetical protein [Catellatospora sp. KI3]